MMSHSSGIAYTQTTTPSFQLHNRNNQNTSSESSINDSTFDLIPMPFSNEDNLQKFSIKYSVTIQQLKRANRLVRENDVFALKYLFIPAKRGTFLHEELMTKYETLQNGKKMRTRSRSDSFNEDKIISTNRIPGKAIRIVDNEYFSDNERMLNIPPIRHMEMLKKRTSQSDISLDDTDRELKEKKIEITQNGDITINLKTTKKNGNNFSYSLLNTPTNRTCVLHWYHLVCLILFFVLLLPLTSYFLWNTLHSTIRSHHQTMIDKPSSNNN
ncbi:hypothetical protein SNEBB_001599 [Seison nebaliae]|nr:hypothetical protein SNEBB_001599 [Seison nebaliae]